MIDSPWPVHETATVASSAHVPAPISGESPTRPEPLAGHAAGRGRGRQAAFGVARHGADRAARAGRVARLGGRARCRSRSVTNQVSDSKSSPAVAANSIAGGPTSSTCRPSASTARAARIGLRTPRTAATAPAARVGAVHDRRVELDAPVLGQRGAAAGVELGVVLEHDDGGLDGVERRAAGRQHRVPGLDGGRRAGAHALGALRVARSARPPRRGPRSRSRPSAAPYHRAPRPPTPARGPAAGSRSASSSGSTGAAAVRAPAHHDVRQLAAGGRCRTSRCRAPRRRAAARRARCAPGAQPTIASRPPAAATMSRQRLAPVGARADVGDLVARGRRTVMRRRRERRRPRRRRARPRGHARMPRRRAPDRRPSTQPIAAAGDEVARVRPRSRPGP